MGYSLRKHLSFDNEYSSSESTPAVGTPTPSKELSSKSQIQKEPTVLIESLKEVLQQSESVSSNNARKIAVSTVSKISTTTVVRRPVYKNLYTKSQSSIFDAQASRSSDFFGFYTLFWVMTAFVILRRLDSAESSVLEFNLVEILLRKVWAVGLVDLAMYLSTYFVVILQLAIQRHYITWNRSGWIIEQLYQTAFIFFYMWFADYMDFPWIGKVFLLLHSLVLIMKMHSYSFYNGYMWMTKYKLEKSTKLLKSQLYKDEDERATVEEEAKFYNDELQMQSITMPFPSNLTFHNFFEFSMFPTLVYQIDYPRTDKIRWGYVAEKVTGTFGIFFLLIVVAETTMYPVTMRALELRSASFIDKVYEFPEILMDLLLPFLLVYLLVFYIIWDAILNSIAELTRFGDREFYSDWWNCVTWDQFASKWNVPVHRFLLRHVYHSSMSSFRVSKGTATFITFFLSSCVHELVMAIIFRKLRGYLLLLQMGQLPLVALSRMSWLKNKPVLGNVIFWIGIITGPTLMCSLYLTF